MTIRWPRRETPTPIPTQSIVPAPDLAVPDRTQRGGASLGVTLERARKRLGISPDAVCQALWLTERELNQYESGLRPPPDTVLERLAEFYGLETEHMQAGAPSSFLPATSPGESDRLWMGWTPVELDSLGPGNGGRLRAVAQAVRFMRGLNESDPFVVRGDEVDVIAEILDIYAPNIVDDITEWFALDQTEAENLVTRLRHSSDTIKKLPPAPEDN